MMNNEEKKIILMITVFAVGGLVGAGTMLLMAPQSGEKTREVIRKKGVEIKDKAVSSAEETRHRAEDRLDDITSQTKDRMSSLKDRGQKELDAQRANLKKKVRETRERVTF
jgi:gas vesicle protein